MGRAGAWGRGTWKLRQSLPLSLSGLSNLLALVGLAETPCVDVCGGHFSHVHESLLKHTCLWYRAQAYSPAQGGTATTVCFQAGLKIGNRVLG